MAFRRCAVPLLVGFAAVAANAGDCPPLGSLPTYVSGTAEQRDFDNVEFNAGAVPGANENGYLKVGGRVCKTAYTPKDGSTPLADKDIQAGYRAQIVKLGGKVTKSGDNDTVARLDRDGKEIWLVVYSQETEIDVTVVEKQAPKYVLTAPAAGDYRLIGHMPNYVASPVEMKNDKVDFHVDTDEGGKDLSISGKVLRIAYTPKGGMQPNSDIEIQSNYRQRLQELGAQFFSTTDDRRTTARLEDQGTTLWITLYSQETEIDLTVVEEKPIQSVDGPAKADTLKSALDKDGHVALSIHFDFNKATLIPDAKAVIDQVLALLKSDATLKLEIDGHTDNIGTREANAKLSQQRAAAVVAALTQAGIAPARLSSNGYGAEQPIEKNETAEGRARNRRVELVKR